VSRQALRIALVAVATLGLPAIASALSLGPFPLVFSAPSAITPEGGSALPLGGAIDVSIDALPVVAPTLFELSGLGANVAGGGQITLDPTLATPALGVVQADGSFLIPTLFLRLVDGATTADLAVPNVTGSLIFGSGAITGLTSSFQVDAGEAGGIVTVNVVAAVPEPGTALLLLLGLGALAAKEVSR